MLVETINNYETVSPIIIYQSAEKTHVSFNIARLVYCLNYSYSYVASYISTCLHTHIIIIIGFIAACCMITFALIQGCMN